jgi:hypothetical protein
LLVFFQDFLLGINLSYYFKEQEQFEALKKRHDDEIKHHEEEIQRHLVFFIFPLHTIQLFKLSLIFNNIEKDAIKRHREHQQDLHNKTQNKN